MDNRRVLLPLAIAVLVGGAAASSLSAGTPKLRAVAKTTQARVAPRHVNPRLTRNLRAVTWRWEIVMGLRRSRLAAPLNAPRALRFWRRHARYVRRLAVRPPHKRGWLCIHHFEGSWRDSGDPYWGGLQMDLSFQETYGGWLLQHKGTADHWSPLEQIWVAVRAWRVRGFSPWPNTAHYCGMA